jgi:hypothetical protein
LIKEILQKKSTKFFFVIVIQENLSSILQFVLKSLREVFSELDQNILIEFLTEKVFYPLFFSHKNFDFNLLKIFKLNLGADTFDKVFLLKKIVTKKKPNSFFDLFNFSISCNHLNDIVTFSIDEGSDILKELLSYRSEDGGSFLHLIISKEKNLKLIETDILIVKVIKKIFEHKIERKEIETFILMQNKTGKGFLHLLSERQQNF